MLVMIAVGAKLLVALMVGSQAVVMVSRAPKKIEMGQEERCGVQVGAMWLAEA